MAKNKQLLIAYKLFFGGLGLSAVITEIAVLIHRGVFVPANFFSYFTVQSNMLAAAMLIGGGVLVLRGTYPRWLTMARGAVTLYMAMTGIIFALLLSGLDAGALTAIPWDNTVLHYIMPFVVFVDWLIDPPRSRLSFTQGLAWLSYPVVYLSYTLIRGHMAGWYPYPFLDASDKGYASVLLGCMVMAGMVAGLTWLIVRRTNGVRSGS